MIMVIVEQSSQANGISLNTLNNSYANESRPADRKHVNNFCTKSANTDFILLEIIFRP